MTEPWLAKLARSGPPTARLERRGAVLEVRADAAGRKLAGYAATFGTPADIGGAFTETIRAGAFAETLRSTDDILALVDHDPTRLLARTRSRTLRLAEDRQGLAFELDLPATTLGADMLALASRGDLGGMSFGFRPVAEDWRDGGKTRELRAVELVEISVVSAWPAYEGTTVAARGKHCIPGCSASRFLEMLRDRGACHRRSTDLASLRRRRAPVTLEIRNDLARSPRRLDRRTLPRRTRRAVDHRAGRRQRFAPPPSSLSTLPPWGNQWPPIYAARYFGENLPVVLACVQAIAGGIASLPMGVYRRTASGRQEAPNHPVARLLQRPNELQTGADFFEWLIASSLLSGNAVAVVDHDARGAPTGLYPIPWWAVQPILIPAAPAEMIGSPYVPNSKLVFDVTMTMMPWPLAWGPAGQWLSDPLQHRRGRFPARPKR